MEQVAAARAWHWFAGLSLEQTAKNYTIKSSQCFAIFLIFCQFFCCFSRIFIILLFFAVTQQLPTLLWSFTQPIVHQLLSTCQNMVSLWGGLRKLLKQSFAQMANIWASRVKSSCVPQQVNMSLKFPDRFSCLRSRVQNLDSTKARQIYIGVFCATDLFSHRCPLRQPAMLEEGNNLSLSFEFWVLTTYWQSFEFEF